MILIKVEGIENKVYFFQHLTTENIIVLITYQWINWTKLIPSILKIIKSDYISKKLL